ncbi:MAG: hypothetical protein ACLFWF_15285, partial [Alphaproteobacteria bacterium]
LKKYEFRRWPAPRRCTRQRIVIHAAKRPLHVRECADLLADNARLPAILGDFDSAAIRAARTQLDGVVKGWPLPLACGLATVTLGEPRRALDLFAAHMNPDEIDPDMWAWPLGDVERFAEPVPARGRQGFWEWEPERAAEPDLFDTANPKGGD